MNTFFARVAGPLFMAFSFAAIAAPTLKVDDDGKLIGANGINVLGQSYDVRFLDGSCASLYSGCYSSSPFQLNQDQAMAASQALLSEVFVDSPLGAFGSLPGLTRGCSNDVLCMTITPLSASGASSSFVMFAVSAGHYSDPALNFVSSAFSADVDTGWYNSVTHAYFAPSVPEPGTLALATVGLILIGAGRRRMSGRHATV